MVPLSSAAVAVLRCRIVTLTGWVVRAKRNALTTALVPLIRSNVVLDQTATAAARETEVSRVRPVVISLKRNQVIAA